MKVISTQQRNQLASKLIPQFQNKAFNRITVPIKKAI